jgi:SWI/SNF-related matrix-associated actin-dependent regulator of chromatin subfamily A-like protein 1
MKLLAHQEVSKKFLLDKKRAILADQPRVGKTLPTAAAAAMHLPAIIVCPSIAKTVWQRAFNTINPDLKVTVINGKKEAQGIARCDVVIINYDVVQHVTPTIYNKFCTLVLDESHRIKSPDAVRTKTCMAMMREIERVYALSGTPIPNRPIELWPLLNGLGIYRNGYYEFATRYARMWKAPWGLDVSGSSNLPELKALMQPHVLRRRKEDVFTDYNEPQVSLITFDLPVDKREQLFDADALVENPNALMAFEGLAEVMKEAGLRKVKPATEFIENLMESNEQVVVFVHHKDVAAQLTEALKKHKPATITGDTPRKQRDTYIDEFQAGKRLVVIGNIAAMSEGVDLSAADTVVFVEATWQTSALEQASSRIENISKQSFRPLIYLLTIRASLDHNVLGKVLRKLNVIDQII